MTVDQLVDGAFLAYVSDKGGDQAQVGDLGLALVEAGAGVGPIGHIRLGEAGLRRAALDGVDVRDRTIATPANTSAAAMATRLLNGSPRTSTPRATAITGLM